MLISDSHQFIFIHVRKAAGTTLRKLLEPLSLPFRHSRWQRFKSHARLVRDYQRYAFRPHEPLQTAQRVMPRQIFESYFKFAFVRNPWERLVSEYQYILQNPDHHRHQRVSRLENFETYIHYQARRHDAHQYRQLSLLEGEPGLDFTGRVESFTHDWAVLCDQLGIEADLPEKHNQGPVVDYRDMYTERTRELVRRLWQRDIELFEYDFVCRYS